jgi:hypothetical protein
MTGAAAPRPPLAIVLGLPNVPLPPAFRVQFIEPIEFGDAVLMTGVMEEVWHRPRWMAVSLWLSSMLNICFPKPVGTFQLD